MEVTLGQQLNQFFLSCGMGFLLGLYYDVYRVIRLVMHTGKKGIFVQDLLFSLTSAVLTFLFSLAVMEGRLRFYLFFGEALGFFAYYFTIGRVVMRFAGVVTAAVVRVWNAFWRLVSFPFRLLVRLLRRPAGAILRLFQKIGEKAAQLLKKGLKQAASLLYNRKKGAGKTPLAAVEREADADEGR
ncbi:MAG TPA: spore cortex biosynthesis protein YabQ [Firmicutes bacterium]|nr:spore cortex biosynthesis protein YabQ [Bacillota bacterium]